MPEWLWALLIGVVVTGLIGIIYRNHQDRLTRIERDIEDLRKHKHHHAQRIQEHEMLLKWHHNDESDDDDPRR